MYTLWTKQTSDVCVFVYVYECSVYVCNRVDRVGSRPLPPCLYASVAQLFLYYFQAAFVESGFDIKTDSFLLMLLDF